MKAPRGKGLYLRDVRTAYVPYGGVEAFARAAGATWVAALDPNVSDAELEAMKRAGLEVYLYTGDGPQWHPGAALATFRKYVARAHRLGLAGVIADIEGGWPSSAEPAAVELAGELVAAAKSGLSVGFTSYPAHQHMATFGRIAGAYVWGSPQIYGQRLAEPDKTQSWLARWSSAGWQVLVPSVAGWSPEGRWADARDYAIYLASFGKQKAVAFWQAPGRIGGPLSMPGHMLAQIADWKVGGPGVGAVVAVVAACGALYVGSKLL